MGAPFCFVWRTHKAAFDRYRALCAHPRHRRRPPHGPAMRAGGFLFSDCAHRNHSLCGLKTGQRLVSLRANSDKRGATWPPLNHARRVRGAVLRNKRRAATPVTAPRPWRRLRYCPRRQSPRPHTWPRRHALYGMSWPRRSSRSSFCANLTPLASRCCVMQSPRRVRPKRIWTLRATHTKRKASTRRA